LSATHATRTSALVALNTLLLCSAVDVDSPHPHPYFTHTQRVHLLF